MRPRVTIIIPTYNRASVVGRAIESVLAQSYDRISVVVVDDGSTDDTMSALRRYAEDARVTTVRLERNVGVTGAKNAGLDRLPEDAELFGIVDSDCWLVPRAIEMLVAVHESSDGRHSQILGWSVDAATGEVAGSMSHRQGLVTYDDALSGAFEGEFFHLAVQDALGTARFDARAAGAESSVWWPMLKQRDGMLIDAVVHMYDTSGDDRVSAPGHDRARAVGRMWACQASLDAVGRDMRERYPRRYGESLVELAKWSALAGDQRRARAASRLGMRYARSSRSIAMALVILLPVSVLRVIVGRRSRARASEDAVGPANP